MRHQSIAPNKDDESVHRNAIATNKKERAANSKTLHGFNTWLVGGTINPKRDLFRIELNVQHTKSNGAVGIENQIEKRKVQIAEQQKKPSSEYKPKANVSQLRLDRIGVVQRGHGYDTSPRGDLSRPVTSSVVPLPSSPNNAAEEIRMGLKSSLLEQAANSSYVSLFPPMFTPMDHAPHHLRGWHRNISTYHDNLVARPVTNETRTFADIHYAPTVKRGESAPNAFQPTGNASTAYRHFTNYKLAVMTTQGDAKVASRAKAHRELQDILRKSVTRSPPKVQPLQTSMVTKTITTVGKPKQGHHSPYQPPSVHVKHPTAPQPPMTPSTSPPIPPPTGGSTTPQAS
eukprot:PhF_6_TR41669/c0_g1_i1/m.63173